MKSIIIEKESVDFNPLNAYPFLITYLAWRTTKGFCIATSWYTNYYVYPKTKGRIYSLALANLFKARKGIWK